MSPVAKVNTAKTGTCPHGLPFGACPICSGMGGGGAMKRADHTAKPGEMSWNECAAIGRMLKAQAAAKKRHNLDYQNRVTAMAKFQANMNNLIHKAVVLANMMANISIAKPVAMVINKAIVPVFNVIKNIPVNIVKFMTAFQQRMIDIQDKLNAVFGEFKAVVEKKISESWMKFKEKTKSIFAVLRFEKGDNEENKLREDKKIFNLKTFIHKLYLKFTEESIADKIRKNLSDK